MRLMRPAELMVRRRPSLGGTGRNEPKCHELRAGGEPDGHGDDRSVGSRRSRAAMRGTVFALLQRRRLALRGRTFLSTYIVLRGMLVYSIRRSKHSKQEFLDARKLHGSSD